MDYNLCDYCLNAYKKFIFKFGSQYKIYFIQKIFGVDFKKKY